MMLRWISELPPAIDALQPLPPLSGHAAHLLVEHAHEAADVSHFGPTAG